MKKSYDVVGAGESLSGLVACVLLGGKGFSCLWIDTAADNQKESYQNNIVGTVTSDFFDKCFRPLVRPIDLDLAESLMPQRIGAVQSIVPGTRIDLAAEESFCDPVRLTECSQKYQDIVKSAMNKPWQTFNIEKTAPPALEGWQLNALNGFSRTLRGGKLSYLRMMTAMRGLYRLGYGEFKDVLGDSLASGKGDYVKLGGVNLKFSNNQAGGLKFGDSLLKGRYYLNEMHDYGRSECLSLYFSYEVDQEAIPVGMADMAILSPPAGMVAPVTLHISRSGAIAHINASTKVDKYDAAQMDKYAARVRDRIVQVIPFMDNYKVRGQQADACEDNRPKQWFLSCENVKAPGFLGRKKFINPAEKVFACDRLKDAGLDIEGEILWGVCIANGILKDLNRSDRFGCP